MEAVDKIYYMRAIVGIIAGIACGFIISPSDSQLSNIGVFFGIGIIFYILSHIVAKKISSDANLKTEKKKLILNGIFPFIFLMLMFLIIAYTGIHQDLAG